MLSDAGKPPASPAFPPPFIIVCNTRKSRIWNRGVRVGNCLRTSAIPKTWKRRRSVPSLTSHCQYMRLSASVDTSENQLKWLKINKINIQPCQLLSFCFIEYVLKLFGWASWLANKTRSKIFARSSQVNCSQLEGFEQSEAKLRKHTWTNLMRGEHPIRSSEIARKCFPA